ncbi:metal ABC transporter solute-binding protein, Zn/Mn family [Calothrix sp. PCC 7507]|uniref:metal ABC transporter solute-binding protein, Zn/Mn family n=1 Tax=Calothrix sp. PCC 7507 TaxID=99598 RepID=UPI00029EE088|nr:zinc ABC transporter substrate-binding protein [Calothrix sp. PCC 7507]AFY32940.1 ABC-type metal ion transporter, periplasmic subunit [Calothrix sp. PCC 7507]
MSKKLLSINYLHIALFTLSMGFSGCGNQAANTSFTQTTRLNNNLTQVVATTSILCDLTKQIADNTVNLTCLIPPGADPHVYRPKPEDRKALEQANLILYNGYNLEPGLVKIIKATKSSTPKIAVGQLAVTKPQQFQENGKRVIDPHIWHDPQNTIKMVEIISNKLGKIEPTNATTYNSNKEKIINELTQLNRWIKSRVASIPTNQRKLVTTHNALGYYARAYGFSLTGTLEGLNTEQRPTSARVKSLVQGIKKVKVPTIFAETTINPNLVQSVARNAEVRISDRELYTDSIGEPGSEGESYQKMMVANTRTIVEGLGGTYLIFEPKASQ